ncbi:MAG: polynucleotide adenylyltransferase PcnB [Sphaerochaetaceae bacterium]|nr:polynucleotide adenylyltransferase PcnB [Sphaerochaetaceae bacterium]
MKVRYKHSGNRTFAVAEVYSEEEHGIHLSEIDDDAVLVVGKLRDSGFETYIVGGAVRDLILGKIPKDFDVVTQATPRQIHRIFRNSMIIGRRFRLVHVIFGQKIIEVSTFRSRDDKGKKSSNVFGTIEEDATKRDFSINSLYYDPFENVVIDYTGAMKDIRKGVITSLIPLNRTFREDPVRMIRALKYSVTTGFKLKINLRLAIRRYASLLMKVSSSRMTEEVNKIFYSGYCCPIIKKLSSYGLLVYMMPCASVYSEFESFTESLEKLDRFVLDIKENSGTLSDAEKSHVLFLFASSVVNTDFTDSEQGITRKDIVRQIKVLISPNTPPNYIIERAAAEFIPKNKKVNKSGTPSRKKKQSQLQN